MRDQIGFFRLMGGIFAGIGAVLSVMMLAIFLGATFEPPMLLMLIMPAVFGGVGIGMLVHARNAKALETRLRREGRPLMGTITGFIDSSLTINNERLQLAVVKGDDDKRYLSGPIRLMKTDWDIDDRVGIYVDQRNPEKYYVDVSTDGPQDLPRGNDYGELGTGPYFPQLPPASTDDGAPPLG